MPEVKPVAGDLAIPTNKYPHLRETDTLQDAVATILSFTCGENERLMYSELFVLNEREELVGRVSLKDILKTLDKRLVEIPKVERFEGKGGDYSNLVILWEESFFIECSKKQGIQLKNIMNPVDRVVKVDDSLVRTMSLLLHSAEQALPVVDGASVAGFIRLEEIFKAVCGLCRI